MTTDLDDGVDAAITELTSPKNIYEYGEELALAGGFVARYGPFGELFEEPELFHAQNAGLFMHAAWSLIGHWSVNRGDPTTEPARGFDNHVRDCHTCFYLEGVLEIRAAFEGGPCTTCGAGLDEHDVGKTALGTARAICPPSVWERVEPLVGQGGDAAEYQTSDAFNARWVAELTDGTFAVVTRTYYIGQVNEDHGPHIDGVPYDTPFVERQDEYLVCTDPADPGGTEIGNELRHVIVESDDPAGENPAELAEQSFVPDADEWREHGVAWAADLLPEV